MSSAATVAVPTKGVPFETAAHSPLLFPVGEPHTDPTVFVLAEDKQIRQALELLIRSQTWDAQSCDSVSEFIAKPYLPVPCCLILAFSATDSNCLEVQRRIVKECAEIPIVIVADRSDIPTSVQAMKSGASDFLIKPYGNDLLLSAISQGLLRSRASLKRRAAMRDLRGAYASLTSREQEVMMLVASGLMNKEVGTRLGISEITVKAHRGSVMRKMAFDSFAHLVNAAVRLRIVR
jgi:FixJ family two-component response regulator